MTTVRIRETRRLSKAWGSLHVDRWVLVAVIVMGGLLAWLSIRRFAGYNTGMHDLGNMAQSIWTGTRGRPLELTYKDASLSRLALHVELIYFLIVPLYRLFPSPVTLLMLQALLFVLGAFPLYALANRRLERPGMARIVAFTYLVYPAALSSVLFDFHGDTLAVPLLCFALEALDRRAWRGFAIWAGLALLCKFYVAAPVAILGILLLLDRERRAGLIIFGMACLYGALAFLVIRPLAATAGAADTPAQASILGYLRFYFGRVQNLAAFDPLPRLATALVIFAPALWLGWRAARWLVPALVVALPSLIAVGDISAYGFRFHHYALAVPFLCVAVIYGAARLRELQTRAREIHARAPEGRRRGRPWRGELGMTLAMTLMFTIGLIDVPLNPLFWVSPPGWGMDSWAYGRTSRDVVKDAWLVQHVPSETPVMTSMMLAPHLTDRFALYLFAYPSEPEFEPVVPRLARVDMAIADALFDYTAPGVVTGFASGHPHATLGGVLHDLPAIRLLLSDPEFALTETRDGLLLFERAPASGKALVQRVAALEAREASASLAEFDDAIALLDAGVVLEGRRLHLHFEWQPLTSMVGQPALIAVSRLDGVPDARMVHLPTLALRPTFSWLPGQVIEEEFIVVLPD
ncbi:MAG: DUF2079 domain-containing protein, partial [Anaerolineae bacterium]|nr:DUF2079 domain-containing protein [Anaerolineae bacterium]